jgi:hypothetical protein
MVDQRLGLVATQVEPEDAATIHHENPFGGRARSLVWAIVFEAGLVVAMLLCGLLWLCLLRYLHLHDRTGHAQGAQLLAGKVRHRTGRPCDRPVF